MFNHFSKLRKDPPSTFLRHLSKMSNPVSKNFSIFLIWHHEIASACKTSSVKRCSACLLVSVCSNMKTSSLGSRKAVSCFCGSPFTRTTLNNGGHLSAKLIYCFKAHSIRSYPMKLCWTWAWVRFVLSLLNVLHNVVHVIVALLGGGAGDELGVYNNLQAV